MAGQEERAAMEAASSLYRLEGKGYLILFFPVVPVEGSESCAILKGLRSGRLPSGQGTYSWGQSGEKEVIRENPERVSCTTGNTCG